MSRSRFYDRSIAALKETGNREIAEDIECYVNSLRLDKALLVSELDHADTFRGKTLLKELGYGESFSIPKEGINI